MRYHIKGTKGRLKDVKSEHCQKSRKKGPVHNVEEMVISFREYLAFSDEVGAQKIHLGHKHFSTSLYVAFLE